MEYTFKPKPEAIWFVLTAVLLLLMQTAATFDPATIVNWRVWAVALGGAVVRTGGGAFIEWYGKHKDDPDGGDG